MVLGDLEVTDESTVTSGELNHMMLLLEQHNRYIHCVNTRCHHGTFYWKEKDNRTEKMKKAKGPRCKRCGSIWPEPKVQGPFKSFLACLYQAVGPWHGENG